MNTDHRWKISLAQLGKALARLSDILKEPLDKNDYVLDATIQRYYPEMDRVYTMLVKKFSGTSS